MKLRTMETAAMLLLAGALMLQNGMQWFGGRTTIIVTVDPADCDCDRGYGCELYVHGDGSRRTCFIWTCTFCTLHCQPPRNQIQLDGNRNCTSGQMWLHLAADAWELGRQHHRHQQCFDIHRTHTEQFP